MLLMSREKVNLWDVHRRVGVLLKLLPILLFIVAAVSLFVAVPVLAQNAEMPAAQLGKIVGTVTDVNDNTVPGASVVLQGPLPGDRRSVVTTNNGAFEFHDVKPGIPYHVSITEKGFADWTSPAVTLTPGQYRILTGSKLRIAQAQSTINVGYDPVQVATEQVRVAESQRVFGIIPNFYVVYDKNPAPLTPKLKFQLALRVSYDPVTWAGIAVIAGANQAGDKPSGYGQGAQGYAKRFGATTLDGFTDIMIGGAILPSLLHQDPRYFYQGTGTVKSRTLHALSYPFACKGDNGKRQPNYSSLGGDLAASALTNLYYPASDRGVGMTFENFAISTGERMVATLFQEFVLRKLTRSKDSKVAASEPSQSLRSQDR
jgi:Carboxypeptidase regulatory-like domain